MHGTEMRGWNHTDLGVNPAGSAASGVAVSCQLALRCGHLTSTTWRHSIMEMEEHSELAHGKLAHSGRHGKAWELKILSPKPL